MIFTVILWATAANVATDLFAAGVNPFELAVSSMAIATFGFAILDSFLGQAAKRPLRGTHAKGMSRQQFVLGLLFAGLTGANYLAIARLPVAVAIVLLFTSPIMVVLWTALTSQRIPSQSVLVALLLSVVGVILVSKVLAGSLDQFNGFGFLVGLASAVFFTAYNMQSERVGVSGEPVGVMLKTFAVASLFWLAYQLTQGIPLTLFNPQNLWKILYMGIAGNMLPYLLFFWGIQRIRAERAVIIATLEPVIASGLAWVWFDQTLTIMQIIGGVLIIIAVTSLQLTQRQE
ncbi:EamA family transporter [Phormidium tenue FACHB-886]|nr:EamA family transporter [Phormidium tenue FACHB-886]